MDKCNNCSTVIDLGNCDICGPMCFECFAEEGATVNKQFVDENNGIKLLIKSHYCLRSEDCRAAFRTVETECQTSAKRAVCVTPDGTATEVNPLTYEEL